MSDDLQGLFLVGTFMALFLSVPYWFWLIWRLDKHMKVHHPALHRNLGIGDLLPGSVSEARDFDNADATLSLARFLWQRGDRDLNDTTVSRIVTQMRGFAVFFLSALLMLIGVAVMLDT